MGAQRASRRKVVLASSDGEDSAGSDSHAGPLSQGSDDFKPGKRSRVKTTPVKGVSPRKGIASKPPLKTSPNARGKAVKAVPAKSNAKPIYSFFNQSSQIRTKKEPSASPGKTSTTIPLETIQDDSEGDSNADVFTSAGSSTALAVRKRKELHSEQSNGLGNSKSFGSHKFYKTNSGGRVPSLTLTNNDKRPWTEQFAPKDLAELAVHKRKVDDVRQWFESTARGRQQRVLVLKGAAGTGKTTTVKLLARDLGLQVVEWKAPAGADLTAEGAASASAQFADFVGRAGRSAGLQLQLENDSGNASTPIPAEPSAEGRQLLLVEEFPNTFSRASSTLLSFRSAILQHLSTPLSIDQMPTPIVMVVSETLLSTNTALADSFTAHRLLGPELSNHPYLTMIEFNAIAPTILTKALQTIVLKEARISGRRKTPGPQVLKSLAEAGDIRSAVSSLEFLCLRGDDGDIWSSKVIFTKVKKPKADYSLTNAEVEVLKMVSHRESTLGIFHSIGKVVYNKRADPPMPHDVPQPPPWLPQYRRIKVPENDADHLIDELGTDTTTFFAALHENYALSCCGPKPDEALDYLSGCIDCISDADLLSIDRFAFGTRAFSGSATDSLRQDEMAFQVAVRGLWFCLPSPVNRGNPPDGRKGDAHRMFYPASLRIWKQREEVQSILDLLTARLKTSDDITQGQPTMPKLSSGVESWRRNPSLDLNSAKQSASDPVDTPFPPTVSSAKMEMLLERLPYMARILDSRAPALAEQIGKVTRVRGAFLHQADDEDADVDADASGERGVEHETWNTDRPEVDAEFFSPRKKQLHRRSRPSQTASWTNQSIPAVVESRVEALVLEDDDIVDE